MVGADEHVLKSGIERGFRTRTVTFTQDSLSPQSPGTITVIQTDLQTHSQMLPMRSGHVAALAAILRTRIGDAAIFVRTSESTAFVPGCFIGIFHPILLRLAAHFGPMISGARLVHASAIVCACFIATCRRSASSGPISRTRFL